MKHFSWVVIGIIVLCLAATLLPGCVSKSEYEALQAERATLVEENTSLKGELEGVQSDLARVQSDLTDVQADYNTLKAEHEELSANYEAIKKELAEIKEVFRVFDGEQPPYSKTLTEPVYLINKEGITDPSWQQLKTFLAADETDKGQYLPGFHVCAGFAEKVHNNAEAAGIRAAWVVVEFEGNEEPHALNAFDTTDRGWVLVDCTGLPPFLEVEISNCDKIAYVVIRKEYGCISLDVAASPEYTFYETYSTKWEEYFNKLEAYNQEANDYEQALGGRVYLHEPEYSKFKAWYDELNSMAQELEAMLEDLGGFYWEPLGVVSKIEIYW